MKPESLSWALARLRDVGVHVPQNRVAIADVAALREFTEEYRAVAWSPPDVCHGVKLGDRRRDLV